MPTPIPASRTPECAAITRRPPPYRAPALGACRLVLLALAASLTPAVDALAQTHVSLFDTDAEGWTLADARSGTGAAPVNWQPPGHIQTGDVFDWTAFSAPAAWLDQPGRFVGGSLSFDLLAARQDAAAASYFTAAWRAGPDLLVWFGGAPSSTAFTRFEVALDATAGWRLNPASLNLPGTGQVLDAAAFAAFLERADALYVNADWRFGADDVRLDNVVLQAVPEPASWLMLFAGSALLLARRRRDRDNPAGPV